MQPIVSAIILAGGYSSRMKNFKPLLPLGSQRVIERVVRNFQMAGIEHILVVLGHKSNELLPVVRELRVASVINENFKEGMYSSVQVGVRSLEEGGDGFFLLPVDIPIIQPSTILKLYETFSTDRYGILYPTFQGKRGHPPLISCKYIPEILEWKGAGGLRAFLDLYENNALNVEVEDQGILMDMDTPKDYQRMLRLVSDVSLPTEEECYKLHKFHKSSDQVIEHCQKVAELSLWFGKRLWEAGHILNLELIKVAALLHDIAKGQANHAQAGAEIMADYPEVAKIIATHMDIKLDPTPFLSEAEIVYLADKMIDNKQIIPLEDRLQKALERFSHAPQIQRNIRQRFENAQRILARIEEVLQGNT